jgi:tetratricopeptide (TPR) repeat protein
VEGHLGQTEKADRLFEKAILNARLSDSRRVESDVIVWRLAMQCWGYLRAGAGILTSTALLEEGKGGLGDAFALVVRGRYRALQGDLTEGRADMDAGRALIRDFGTTYYIEGSAQEQAMLELEAENPAGAEAALRERFGPIAARRPEGFNSTAAGLLARALDAQGRLDEAAAFVRLAETIANADDLAIQSLWRYVKASLLAKTGDLDAAETLARDAVAFGERTDFLEEHAQALLTLARVLEVRGRVDEARQALESALRLYARKESILGVERVRQRLRELAGEPLAERQ